LPIKEGKKKGPYVGTVNVCIGHDDYPPKIAFIWVEGIADAASKGGNKPFYLFRF
jgi:hypothetical protein